MTIIIMLHLVMMKGELMSRNHCSYEGERCHGGECSLSNGKRQGRWYCHGNGYNHGNILLVVDVFTMGE